MSVSKSVPATAIVCAGLVGMLPAHEIGGLLVEIDARNRRNGFLRLARERRLASRLTSPAALHCRRRPPAR